MSQAQPSPQPAQSQVIRVTKPATGTTQALESRPGAELQLEFPEGQATFGRAGNDLTVKVDGGGDVTLTNFFVVGNESLPTLVLADGTKVAAADFLAAQYPNMDLTTAAGPGGAAPGSGGEGSYADDPGALLGGIDKYGKLGTVFWDRNSEVPDVINGVERPFADITISIDTMLPPPPTVDPDGRVSGTFINTLFEDSQPNQHLDGAAAAREPGILQIQISTQGTTSVTSLDLSGFRAGTVIEIEGGRTITISGPGQVVALTPAEIAAEIRVFAPEDNSDADMGINYSLNLVTAGGVTGSTTGSFILVVDAVADKPEVGDMGFVEAVGQNHAEYTPGPSDNTDPAHVTYGELENIIFPVNVYFGDTIDGSERHTVEVRGVPADWHLDTTTGLGAEYAVSEVVAADGTKTYTFEIVDTDNVEGIDLLSHVKFNTQDWTSDRLADGSENTDGPAHIQIVAVADEDVLSGGEATLANNHAETVYGEYEVNVVEDTPDFTGPALRILSDESKGVQHHTDEISIRAFRHDVSLQGILADLRADGVDIPAGRPVSVARGGISYDLHSDGTDDTGGNAGKAHLGFEGTNGADSGWSTSGGEKIYMYFDAETGAVIGRVGDASGANPTGAVAFVVVPEGTLHNGDNTGSVTFIQYMSLDHPRAGDGSHGTYNEKLVGLNLTLGLTDDDGDHTQLNVNLNVRDDGPNAGDCPAINMVFETQFRIPGTTELQANGHLFVNFGADDTAGATAVYWDVTAIAKEVGALGEDLYATVGPKGENIKLEVLGGATNADHPTELNIGYKDPVTGADVVVIELKITQDAAGHYKYEYNQLDTLKHGPHGSAEDIIKALNFQYVVQDSDGDTDTNSVVIKVVDDHVVSSADGAHLDESYDMHKTHVFDLDRIDYNAPDGIADVVWNQALIAKALGAYHATGYEGFPLEISVSADGKMLTVSADGHTVFTAEISETADGMYHVGYTQDMALHHLIPGLAHDDPLPLLLTFDVIDGDGDKIPNLFTIVVDDDGPEGLFAANVLALQYVGQALLEGLNDLEFKDVDAFMQSVSKVLGDSLAAGLKGDALIDLADLLLNSNLRGNGSGGIFGTDSDRTEGNGPYTGTLNPDFGVDGPAAHTPVGWSVIGVQSMLTLLGIEAVGHDGSLKVREMDGLNTIGKPVSVLHVDAADGTPILTLELSADGKSYSITQHAPLEHNASAIDALLGDALTNALNSGNIPPELQTLINTLGADGIAKALSGGNLLTLPLPIVITDGDGDMAPGMISITIRDSVPVNGINVTAVVSETDISLHAAHGHEGTDSGHATPVGKDDTHFEGTFNKFNFGFDGPNAGQAFAWDAAALNKLAVPYKTADGAPITWALSDNGLTLTGSAGGVEVVVIKAADVTGNAPTYTVDLKEPLLHPDGEDKLPLNVGFIIRDGDGDTASGNLALTVKDDAPQANTNWDKVGDADLDGTWTADGNIISGAGTFDGPASNVEQTADKFGADGRNADHGLKIGVAGTSYDHAETVDGHTNITIHGKYGDLVIEPDGDYVYTVDAARMQAALNDPNFAVPKNLGVSLTGAHPDYQGLTIDTFRTNSSGETPPNSGIDAWVGSHANGTSLTNSSDGVGVKSGILDLNPDVAGGRNTVKEGLCINLPEPTDSVSLSLADLTKSTGSTAVNLGIWNGTLSYTLVEQAKVFYYDAAGNLLGSDTVSGNDSGNITLHLSDSGIAQVVLMPMEPTWSYTASPALPGWLKGAADAAIKLIADNAPTDFVLSGVNTVVHVAPAPGELVDTFDYYLTDKDGDQSKAQLIINANSGPGKPSVTGAPAVVYESDITPDLAHDHKGTDSGHLSPAGVDQTHFLGDFVKFPFGPEGANTDKPFSWTEPTGAFKDVNGTAITWEVSADGKTLTGMAGTVTVITVQAINVTSDTPQYEVTLHEPMQHAGGNAVTDLNIDLGFTIYDRTGDGNSGTLSVKVMDDAPTAADDVHFVVGTAVQTGNVISGFTNDGVDNNTGVDHKGADGAIAGKIKLLDADGDPVATTEMSGIDAGGKYMGIKTPDGAVFKLYVNGEYTYTPAVDGKVDHVFRYTLTDGDGDTDTATISFIRAAELNIKGSVLDVELNEANLDWGTAPNAAALTKTGFIDIDDQDKNFTLKLEHGGNSITLTKAQLENLAAVPDSSKSLFEVAGKGTLTITGYNATTGVVSYSYTLHDDWIHKQPAEDLKLDSIFKVTLTDAGSGLSQSANLDVTILDDRPIAADDFIYSGGLNSTVGGNVLTGDGLTGVGKDNFGADGWLAPKHGVTHVWQGEEGPGNTPPAGAGVAVGVGGTVTVNGLYGTLTLNTDGTYNYTQTKTAPLGGSEKFTYEITDGDNDKDLATLTINFPSEPGKLLVGDNVDDGPGSTTPWIVGGPSHGTITGGEGNDTISGDRGGGNFPPKDYNFVFVLDYSGSMDWDSGIPGKSRELAMEDGIKTMIKQLADYAVVTKGGNVTIYLEAFDTANKGEYALQFTTDMTTAQRDVALNDLAKKLTSAAFTHGNGTNYEVGLDAAAHWLEGTVVVNGLKPTPGATNYSYFISDGEPNAYMNGTTSTSAGAQAAVDGAKADDDWNGWKYLRDNSEMRAIGIGTAADKMTYINQIDEHGAGIEVKDMTFFEKTLTDLNPLKFTEAGDDRIMGSGGSDIIYGDVMCTDALAVKINLKEASGRAMDPGQGWAVFAALEMGGPGGLGMPFHTDANGEVVAGGTWTREDTYAYINAHQNELGHESSWTGQIAGATVTEVRPGGDDLIIGGHGNDTIFGQEGNDVVFGGHVHYNGLHDDAALNSLMADVRADYHLVGGVNPTNAQVHDYLAQHMDKLGAGDANDGNNVLHGGSGDDILIGGGGNDLIYGGTGNDIMFGGAGDDTFAWHMTDYDGGTDKIMDFSLGHDKLQFEDLLDSGQTLGDALHLGKIDVSGNAAGDTLIVTINDGSYVQNVEVHLQGTHVTAADFADEAAKAALLQQMITNSGG